MTAQLSPTPRPPHVLPDILVARAELQPDDVALVVDKAGALTYREWDQRANSFAKGLLARSVGPGDRIGLLFESHQWLEYAVAFFGTLKAGGVAVPISTALPDAEVDRTLSHCGAVAVCCSSDSPPRPFLIPVWFSKELMLGQGHDSVQAAVDASDLAQILYTSGTTGVPKGVACSHSNLLFGIVTTGPELAMARREHVALHALPIGVNAAQVELTRAAHRLARTVILPAFEPERFAALISEHRATVLLLVPAMAIMMVNAGTFDRHDTSSVRRIRLTGAPCPPALLCRLAESLPDAEISNEYALTESTPMAITTIYDPKRPTSVGRPGPAQRVRIVGKTGDDCHAGEVGEVWLSTPGAPLRSYYRDPQATSAVFGGGWLRTDDVGYLDQDGFLYLTDRRSDVIITGGRNVSTLEVEAALHECAAVAEAAVIGMPHAILGEHVTAAVVLRVPTTATDLKSLLRGRLPEYAVPQTMLFVDRLPRGISGKVLKGELREIMTRNLARPSVGPRTPTELRVAAIWAGVLGREEVGVEDRFVDLGGQSISALQVLADIKDLYGVSLDRRILAEAETVAALASALDTLLLPDTDEQPETGLAPTAPLKENNS